MHESARKEIKAGKVLGAKARINKALFLARFASHAPLFCLCILEEVSAETRLNLFSAIVLVEA